MAFLEQRGDRYRIIVKFRGRRFTHSVHTEDRRVAEALRGTIDRTILLIEQRLLSVPEDADLKEFILSGGEKIVRHGVDEPTAAAPPAPVEPLTFARLRDRYLAALGVGSIEENSLDTVTMHLRHLQRTLGDDYKMVDLHLEKLQEHIGRRAKAKGVRKKPLSSVTIRKEIASLSAAWNWGMQAKLLAVPFPNKGLKYPKTTEKPPFQTWQEIERRITQGGLKPAEQHDLWDCLFLGTQEIQEVLVHVEKTAIQPWVYPMFCFAAHTGARRSEITRTLISDIDFEGGTVRIQEKKRARGHRTSRRVPLSAFLARVLRNWIDVHPGSQSLFAQQANVSHSKKERQSATAVTTDEAHDHFKRTLAGCKWRVLRGWHVLRHSFCSCCAARGVDQRLINAWVGHQTEEMVQRYRHLFPTQERQAIELVFG